MTNCYTCFYHDSNVGSCDFYLVTGERRGCSPANCCRYLERTNRQTRTGWCPTLKDTEHKKEVPEWVDRRRQRTAAMRILYDEGLSDQAIARELQCSASTVRRWRYSAGLPFQQERKGAKHDHSGT